MNILGFLRKGFIVYLLILGIGIIYVSQTNFTSLLISTLLIASLVGFSYLQARSGDQPVMSDKDKLMYTQQELQFAREEIENLETQLRDSRNSIADTEKVDFVLRMVAFHLVAYERMGSHLSGDAVLRHLAGAMATLGKNYLKEETANWDPADWTEFYASIDNFR